MKDNLYIIGKHKFGNATVLCVPKCEKFSKAIY